MDLLADEYRFKEGACVPKRYLGMNIKRQQIASGETVWAISPNDYVKNAVKIVQGYLNEDGENYKLSERKIRTPWETNYKPEIDVSNLLDEKLVSRYQNMIGMTRWCIELGRMDILHEISKLSSYSAAPRDGHLQALYRVFAYLSKNPKSCIAFDVSSPPILCDFVKQDLSKLYPDAEELLPVNMPEPRGPPVEIILFSDADHASNIVTRRSHTGLVFYLQNTPILFYSKRQNTVESSTFGSEGTALRIGMDLNDALRYKLRMFGINIAGPTTVYCDNKGVTSAAETTATLQKKHNSINFHRLRECIAAGTIRLGWIKSQQNVADLFTKNLPMERRKSLIDQLLYIGHYVSEGI